MKKKILITGASSFLGEGLAETLKNKFDIILLEHKKPIKSKTETTIIRGNVENTSGWENKLTQVEIIIHLASISHAKYLKRFEEINTQGTINLVNLGLKKGAHQFIYISTRTIGKNCGAYGESKEIAEDYIKNSSINYTIIRPGEAYDENFTRSEGLGTISRLVENNIFIPYIVDKNTSYSPIHIKDVQDGILATVDNPVTYGKTYNLSGPENLSLKQVIKRIYLLKKTHPTLVPIHRIFIQIVFSLIKMVNKNAVLDQLERLLWIRTEKLSKNVESDLKIKPRYFLKDSLN